MRVLMYHDDRYVFLHIGEDGNDVYLPMTARETGWMILSLGRIVLRLLWRRAGGR